MRGEKLEGDLRGMFFIQGVENIWNKLPEEVVIAVEADAITMFDRHLYRYLDGEGVE